MSSRNNLLKSEDRVVAPEIYKRLSWIKDNISKKSNQILIKDSIDFFQTKGLKPEYLKICDPDTLEDLNFLETLFNCAIIAECLSSIFF